MVRSSQEKSSTFCAGCLIWCAGCWWLVSKGLGSIAFVGSALLAIWVFGLRDKFEGETTESAYNVFNKGGKAILGGLTGEQVDQQMRGGMTYRNASKTEVDSNAPLTTVLSSSAKKKSLSTDDKLRRRSTAAAAAERRLEQQKPEMAESSS